MTKDNQRQSKDTCETSSTEGLEDIIRAYFDAKKDSGTEEGHALINEMQQARKLLAELSNQERTRIERDRNVHLKRKKLSEDFEYDMDEVHALLGENHILNAIKKLQKTLTKVNQSRKAFPEDKELHDMFNEIAKTTDQVLDVNVLDELKTEIRIELGRLLQKLNKPRKLIAETFPKEFVEQHLPPEFQEFIR